MVLELVLGMAVECPEEWAVECLEEWAVECLEEWVVECLGEWMLGNQDPCQEEGWVVDSQKTWVEGCRDILIVKYQETWSILRIVRGLELLEEGCQELWEEWRPWEAMLGKECPGWIGVQRGRCMVTGT